MVDQCRSSRPDVFCKKGVLKHFSKFTGKFTCPRASILIKLQVSPATVLKKNTSRGIFLWISRNSSEQLFLQKSSGGCFWAMGKVKTYFQLGRLLKALIMADLWQAVWTCVESEFRFCWSKLYSSDSHHTMPSLLNWLKANRPIKKVFQTLILGLKSNNLSD